MTQTREAQELGLLTANIAIALKDKQNEHATIYMTNMLKHLSSLQSLQELELLIDQVEDKASLLNCIEPKYRFQLLLTACEIHNIKLFDFLTTGNYIQQLSSSEFTELFDILYIPYTVKHDHHHSRPSPDTLTCRILAERQKQNAKLLADELNKDVEYIAHISHHAAILPTLCEFGLDPLLLIKTICNAHTSEVLLKHLDRYSDVELISAFKQMIVSHLYSEAEKLLVTKPGIIKQLKHSELDIILFQAANNTSASWNLIKLLIQSGANLLADFDSKCAFDNFCYSHGSGWRRRYEQLPLLVNDEIINFVSVEVLDKIMRESFSSALLILDKKAKILKEYYQQHKDRLNSLYYKAIRNFEQHKLLLILLDFGADPLLHYHHTWGDYTNGFDEAIRCHYSQILKYILDHHLDRLTIMQLADLFIYAIGHHLDDMADALASPVNSRRMGTLSILGFQWENQYIKQILKVSKPDDPILEQLSRVEYAHEKKEMPLLDFCMKHTKYDMIANIITQNLQQLSLIKVLDAIQFLIDDKNNNPNRAEHIKLTAKINKQLVLNCIHKASTIMDIMTIIDAIKTHPVMLLHIKLELDKEIRETAVKRMLHLANREDHIDFPDKSAYEKTIAFLYQESRFKLLVNYDEDFIRLTKDKIKIHENSYVMKFLPT